MTSAVGILTPTEAWKLVKQSARGWVDDSAPSMGAALAFYTLFSLAPILLLSIAIAGFFMGRDQAQDVMIAQITQLVGAKAALAIKELLDAAGTRGDGKWPALIGIAALAIGATTVFAELRSDLDRIWRCTTKKAGGLKAFLLTRVLSFGLVVSIGFLLLVSLVVSTVLSALGDHWFPGAVILVRGGEFVTSFFVTTGLFAIIYKWLPTTRIAWGDVWVGAAMTSLLFWFGKFLIGLYLARTAVGSAFGAAGTLVVVIMWVYYSAQVFFLGAEFTREYARRHGSRQGEHYLADRRRPPGEPAAANEDLIERAEKIVKGKDPVLVITK